MVNPTRWHYGLTTDTPPTADEIEALVCRWYIAMAVKAPNAPAGPPQLRSEPHEDAHGRCWRTAVFMTY